MGDGANLVHREPPRVREHHGECVGRRAVAFELDRALELVRLDPHERRELVERLPRRAIVREQRIELAELGIDLRERRLVRRKVFGAAREQVAALPGLRVAEHGQRVLQRELSVVGMPKGLGRGVEHEVRAIGNGAREQQHEAREKGVMLTIERDPMLGLPPRSTAGRPHAARWRGSA